jgi:lipopolysaccharide biosynthesis glycosyltransferase
MRAVVAFCCGIAAILLNGSQSVEVGVDQGSAVEVLDIVVFSDKKFAPGVAAIIKAVRRHSSLPARFFIAYEGRSSGFTAFLKCLRVDLDGVTIRDTIPLVSSLEKSRNRLFNRLHSSAANFARFTVLETFPELAESRAAWVLDPDTLPIGDLAEAVPGFVRSGALLGAASRVDGLTFRHVTRSNPNYMSPLVHSTYSAHYGGRPFPASSQPWNAGAYLANYRKWRSEGVAKEAQWWYEENQAKALWQLGTQPLMCVRISRGECVRFCIVAAPLLSTPDSIPSPVTCPQPPQPPLHPIRLY